MIFFRFGVVVAYLLILLVSGCALQQEKGMTAGAGDVERGRYLFNQAGFGGSTNDMSCGSCHPHGTGLEHVAKKFEGKDAELRQSVNQCIKIALKGEGIREDSQAMADVVAYVKSLGGK